MKYYKALKPCTLPGTQRYVEEGEEVPETQIKLAKGQKMPKHLVPAKARPKAGTSAAKQTAGQGPGPGDSRDNSGSGQADQEKESDHSRPDDLDKKE